MILPVESCWVSENKHHLADWVLAWKLLAECPPVMTQEGVRRDVSILEGAQVEHPGPVAFRVRLARQWARIHQAELLTQGLAVQSETHPDLAGLHQRAVEVLGELFLLAGEPEELMLDLRVQQVTEMCAE